MFSIMVSLYSIFRLFVLVPNLIRFVRTFSGFLFILFAILHATIPIVDGCLPVA